MEALAEVKTKKELEKFKQTLKNNPRLDPGFIFGQYIHLVEECDNDRGIIQKGLELIRGQVAFEIYDQIEDMLLFLPEPFDIWPNNYPALSRQSFI